VARAGATTTRRCAQFVLRRLVADRATVAAVARELGRSWDTINTIAMEATTELLDAAGPARLHVAPAPRCAFRSLRSQLGQREKALTGMPGVRSFTPSTPAPSTAEVVEAFRIPAS
jgi:hypothetical protein